MKLFKTDYTRRLRVVGIPSVVEGIDHDMDELEITINYTGSVSILKALLLDGFVIPTIIETVNRAEKKTVQLDQIKQAAQTLLNQTDRDDPGWSFESMMNAEEDLKDLL